MNHVVVLNDQQTNSKCWYDDQWVSPQKADQLYELCEDLALVTNPVCKVFGKECLMPRSVGFFSNTSKGYKYSKQTSEAQPLPYWMGVLLKDANQQLGTQFNGVLVNKYLGGLEKIGPHADDEKELSLKKVAALTLGSSRIFRIKSKQGGTWKLDVVTTHGQLLVMEGEMQQHYTHQIPSNSSELGTRYSLTFRHHS